MIKIVERRIVTWDCVACHVNFGTTEPLNSGTENTRVMCPDCGKFYIVHWGCDGWETWVEEVSHA